jgi:beta propeller repeat protein
MKPLVFLFIIFLLLFTTLPTHAFSAITQRLTTESHQQNGPVINNDLVAWTDWRNDSLDIYGYDQKTNTEIPLITADGHQWAVALTNNQLIYNDESDGRIHFYHLNNHTDTALLDLPAGAQALSIDNQILLYQLGSGYGQIFVYNLDTQENILLSNRGARGKISYPFVSWDIDLGAGWVDFVVYNLESQQYITIPKPDNTIRNWTDLNQHRLAYVSSTSGSESIKVFNLNQNQEIFTYTNPGSTVDRPALSQKYIVWSESPAQHVNTVKAAEFKTGQIITLQEPGPHQNTVTTPTIYKDTAVWMAWRTGNGDIYKAEMFKK